MGLDQTNTIHAGANMTLAAVATNLGRSRSSNRFAQGIEDVNRKSSQSCRNERGLCFVSRMATRIVARVVTFDGLILVSSTGTPTHNWQTHTQPVGRPFESIGNLAFVVAGCDSSVDLR